MTSSFADGLSGYYQIPEDASGAEEVLLDAELIDFGTAEISNCTLVSNNLKEKI